jgi:hypothetical protein
MNPLSNETGVSASPNSRASSRSDTRYRLRSILSGSGVRGTHDHSKIAD